MLSGTPKLKWIRCPENADEISSCTLHGTAQVITRTEHQSHTLIWHCDMFLNVEI